jgi:hypothetical protein
VDNDIEAAFSAGGAPLAVFSGGDGKHRAVGDQSNASISIVGGYRVPGVDHEDSGFVYDVIQHGPTLGAVIRF